MASDKYYPVERKIRVNEVLNVAKTTVKLIDIGLVLSRVNRRLYRQGRYYHVKVHIDSANFGDHRVFTLRNTWDVKQAYKMAYQMYLDNTKEERAKLGKKQIARWEDFRVESGFDITSPTGPNLADRLEPIGFDHGLGQTNFTDGEHTNSIVVDGAGNSKTFSWQSTSSTNVYSIMAEYQNYANPQSSPAQPTTNGPYEDLNTDVDPAIMDSLQDLGNGPPYSVTNDVTRIFTEHQVVSANAGGNFRGSTGTLVAPCGILVVTSNTDELTDVLIEVVAGDYKGVKAPSMLE